eukprot:CAMPEP_0183812650 /NCGR_PEP_ID=MMETSP0803_2-20130417/51578_1 /TAXON_ID=195967 /ORGANISM="Crustomastix stigmata, Strain CCMP3273" /LENGTH=135 /DNA_ID=CAMNT_0026057491 /DNA_START=53 /DNA_END=457 /DNA_ORIENTATION=-
MASTAEIGAVELQQAPAVVGLEQSEIQPVIEEDDAPGVPPSVQDADRSGGGAAPAQPDDAQLPVRKRRHPMVAWLLDSWECLEEHLADIFGLNDSKYQWAVDEYMYQQQQKEERRRKRRERKAARLAAESQQMSA